MSRCQRRIVSGVISSRNHEATHVIRRKTNRRHMISDHHGRTARESQVPLLLGHRGSPAADLETLRGLLLRAALTGLGPGAADRGTWPGPFGTKGTFGPGTW
jgi:hypothetical protein